MNKALTLLLLILVSLTGLSQPFADSKHYLVDSLELEKMSESDQILLDTVLQAYHLQKEDTSKLKTIIQIVEASDDDKVWRKYNSWVMIRVKELLASQTELDTKVLIMLKQWHSAALNNEGYYQKHHGNMASALKYYKQALKIREENNFLEDQAVSHLNIGVLLYNQGDIYNALNHYHEALEIQEKLNDEKGMLTTFNNVGALHKHQGDFELALEYYNKSLVLSKKLDSKKGMAFNYNNIGVVYSKQKKFNEALEYYSKSLELRIALGHKRKIALGYNNIGSVYKNLKKYDEALEYYTKSLQLQQEADNKAGQSTTHSNLSSVHLTLGNLAKAQFHGEKSLKFSQSIGYPENIQSAAGLLSSIYQKQDKFEQALHMHQLHMQMRDSINNKNTHKAALKKQANYEFDKQKALDDAAHEKELALEHEAKEKQKIMTYAAVGGIVLTVLFLLFVFHRLNITRKQKQTIEEQKILVDEANEELNQTNEEILAQRDQIEYQKDIIEAKHTQVQDSIKYALKIQQAILPKEDHVNKALPEHFILFKPRDIVSGDFYWSDVKGEHLFIAAADCTGHGVPGAFMSMLGLSFLNQINRTSKDLSPGEMLDQLKISIIRELKQEGKEKEAKDGMDISLVKLNLNTLELEYAGAYNPLYVINKNRSELCENAVPFRNSSIGWEVKATKRPIGIAYGRKDIPFQNHKIQLQKGDFLCIFTDGYADQFGGNNDSKFTYGKFKELLVNHYESPVLSIKELLAEEFSKWKGTETQTDDVCVIGVKL